MGALPCFRGFTQLWPPRRFLLFQFAYGFLNKFLIPAVVHHLVRMPFMCVAVSGAL